MIDRSLVWQGNLAPSQSSFLLQAPGLGKVQGRNGFRLALPRKPVELGETTIIGFGGRPRTTSVAIYDSILHILGQDH
jgi:hypothetical protein